MTPCVKHTPRTLNVAPGVDFYHCLVCQLSMFTVDNEPVPLRTAMERVAAHNAQLTPAV